MVQAAIDSPSWEAVPFRIRPLYFKYAAAVKDAMREDPNSPDGWIIETEEVGPLHLKSAAAFAPVGNAVELAQKFMGGPNPITAMLLTGALGAGLGAGGGWLAHKIAPDYVRDDAWKWFAPMGAALGAAVPGAIHLPYNLRTHGWKGLVRSAPLQGDPSRTTGMEQLLNMAMEATGLREKPASEKRADEWQSAAGAAYVEDIDVAKWLPVVNRDPFMDPPAKAVAGGLPLATAVAKGSSWVSPADVAKVAANAGMGAVFGRGIGLIAGPFLRLTPKAQDGLQQAGILAGAIKALIGL